MLTLESAVDRSLHERTAVIDTPQPQARPETLRIVAIETSLRAGSIALVAADQKRLRPLPSDGPRHAQSLVQELARLLNESGLAPRDVTHIAVSQGPGSFTGLRVGVTAAKTWAYTMSTPLLLVPTFAAYAALISEPRDVIVVDDAQRGDVFWQHYAWTEHGVRNAGPLQVVPLHAARQQLTQDDLVIGPLATHGIEGTTAQTLSAPLDALTIARLAWPRAQAGEHDDFWTALPLYGRRSSAEEQFDARLAATGPRPT